MDNEKNCAACPVAEGTHKPAEAVHLIAEPQPEALARAGLAAIRLAREGDKQAAETIRAQQARIAELERWQEDVRSNSPLLAELERKNARIGELESQLDAICAGGVEPLRNPAAQTVQAAATMESVLIDGAAYDVHADVAAELLRLHIELQQAEPAAPQAVQADVGTEVLGSTCMDGGTCHHACTERCFRRDCCEPLTIALNAGLTMQQWRYPEAAPQAAAPLPLLLRDIARDLGISVPQACITLKPLGNYSTNSAVTAEMARMLRDHFPAPAHPAEGEAK